jgi:Zinc-finger of C2H2 type
MKAKLTNPHVIRPLESVNAHLTYSLGRQSRIVSQLYCVLNNYQIAKFRLCLQRPKILIDTLDLVIKGKSAIWPYTVSLATNLFVTQSALQQHLNSSIHAPRIFNDQQALEQRLSSSDHALVCDKCNQVFNNQQSLNQHLNSPTHNKPVPSSLINRRLRRYGIVFLGSHLESDIQLYTQSISDSSSLIPEIIAQVHSTL